MKLNRVNVRLVDGYDTPLPRMVKIRQHFERTRLEDPAAAVIAALEGTLQPSAYRGKRMAITAGSRHIAQFPLILRTVIEKLRVWGAEPFIVPAMGSHGGGTAEGQKAVLAGYGITEKTMGVPIVSSMEVTSIATLGDGTPVYCDKAAFASDGIVVVNRVKPHTDFKGAHESGLLKMMAVGLGKHRGASQLHSHGFDQMASLLPVVAEQYIRHAPIAFGVAILENAFDELMAVHVLRPDQFVERERELLETAKKNIGRLPLSSIDILVIEEIGKDVSGAGMDPNVTGIPGSRLLEGFSAPPIQKIVVLGLTKKAQGNATGIGLADVTTIRCVNSIDWGVTYTNCVTATVPESAKMPMVLNNDREALVVALRMCARVSSQTARIVRIKNTLDLTNLEVSEACLPDLVGRSGVKIVSEPAPFHFSRDGWLNRFFLDRDKKNG
jgi:hypothetical protein